MMLPRRRRLAHPSMIAFTLVHHQICHPLPITRYTVILRGHPWTCQKLGLQTLLCCFRLECIPFLLNAILWHHIKKTTLVDPNFVKNLLNRLMLTISLQGRILRRSYQLHKVLDLHAIKDQSC